MRRVHYEVKVPSGSRAVGKLVEYFMEVAPMEAYTTSMRVNPTYMEVRCLSWKSIKPYREVAGRLESIIIYPHGSWIHFYYI